jgi:hypothetical protein
MAVTLVNPEAIPDDLPPGTYCCRLDESSHWGDFRARLITPPRSHEPGDCLIQIVKQPPVPEPVRAEDKES